MNLPDPKSEQELSSELEKKISSIQTQNSEEEARKFAASLSLPYSDLSSFPVDGTAVILLDQKDAKIGQIAIITKNGTKITAAVKDPKNKETLYVLDGLKNRGYVITIVVVSEASLQVAWKRYEQHITQERSEEGIVEITEEEIRQGSENTRSLEDLKNKITQVPITKLIDILIAGALQINASDIHLEPEEKIVRLRYRLDGVLQDVAQIESKDYDQVLSRIKLLSGLKLNIHDTPQDGRFTIRRNQKDIEVRVSILPGAYGENVVTRLLNPDAINKDLGELGMRPELLQKVEKLLKKTTGALLTTGPTGSGKTTTLYAFVKHLNTPDVKIITIEDPVEYHIEGISQTQINETAGYTFVEGLRSIMRQDPDVILVGEIRDKETAEIAMQAALTGHLVFSTLHTNNAAGAIPRLIDLGVRPITIAPAIKATIAQRLVRRLCQQCKQEASPTPEESSLLKEQLEPLKKDIADPHFFSPKGCEVCNGSGYQGRIGVYELFEIDGDIEKLILTSPPISEVQDMAVSKGMITMLQDGLLRALEGITSIDEVIRVVGE